MKKKKSVKKKGINYFFNDNFKLSLEYLKKLKNYILFIFVLFLIIGILGFIFPIFFEEQIIKLVGELVEKTQGLSGLELVIFIFLNNLKSSFFAILLGIFFGFISVFIIIVNAYVLGFVGSKVVAAEGFSILLKLLPHGIFEIPAVIISVAMGLRLGMFLFVHRGKSKKKEFAKWLRDSLRVFIFIIVPLLIIAAIIEGVLIAVGR